MSKILAIFGATGQQGSSLVNYVLKDPILSKEYTIRAITRDVASSKARELAENVEVVQGDIYSRTSLENALTGVHTIFLMTTPTFGPSALQDELDSARTVADVAVATGVEYIIFSTLPAVAQISGGKYTAITPFDAKAQAETYIRSLSIKSAFVSLGGFMENFQAHTFLAPKAQADGSWVMSRNTSAKAKYPWIDAVGDVGKFIGSILANPDKYEGKTFCCATALYTIEEVVAAIAKNTGKNVVFKQVADDEFKKSLGFPPELTRLGDIFTEVNSYSEEFGYFGPDSEELVAWAAGNARGKLSTLEEFLEAHPLQLE